MAPARPTRAGLVGEPPRQRYLEGGRVPCRPEQQATGCEAGDKHHRHRDRLRPRVRAPTATAQTTTSTTRTPEGGSGSHTPATTPTSSATAAGAVGFVTSGRMQDPSRPEPPVSGGSSAQGCGFCAPAVLQLLRFLRSEGTRQGVNSDAILLYGCSCPPVVGRVGCSTRSSPSVFPLSTAGIPSLIQTGAGAS